MDLLFTFEYAVQVGWLSLHMCTISSWHALPVDLRTAWLGRCNAVRTFWHAKARLLQLSKSCISIWDPVP